MPRRVDIYFVDDTQRQMDEVIVAVAPFDAFTGLPVRSDLEVHLEGWPYGPIRNLSGMFVFIRSNTRPEPPPRAEYQVVVSARGAGYFDPQAVGFVPVPSNDPDVASKRKLAIPLYRRPSAAADLDDTTLVAGVIRNGEEPLVDARISAQLPPDTLPPGEPPHQPFETRSDERGTFMLPLRLPVEAITAPIPVTFKFRKDAVERSMIRQVREGERYSFKVPIDLGGDNQPPLVGFGDG